MDESMSTPSLYELEVSGASLAEKNAPVLVHALEGFVDAGRTIEKFITVMKEQQQIQLVASFDGDAIFDYRARRPIMRLSGSKIVSADLPKLELYAIKDSQGKPLLFLCGSEPDFQWQRFTVAIEELCKIFGVEKVIGLHAIPTSVPHTRPIIINAHASDIDLIKDKEQWDSDFSFPGSISAYLDYCLGQKGFETLGLSVHIPHYLQQMEYPEGTRAALMEINSITGFQLNTDKIFREAAITRENIDRQISESSEAQALISGLEKQYDSYIDAMMRKRSLLTDDGSLPSGDEIAVEFEKFLANLNGNNMSSSGPEKDTIIDINFDMLNSRDTDNNPEEE